MTVIELVDRERTRLRRLHLVVGLALAVGATCLLLALGAGVLGSARWMALPRPVPFLVWLLVLAADVAVIVWTARRLERRTTRQSVAATIEREQSLRAGALRGALEVANTGALGRRAADAVSQKLAPAGPHLAPVERRQTRRGATQASVAAGGAIAALMFAAPNFGDGLSAIMRPIDAWHGTLLPRITFENIPPAVLRGESMRLRIAAPRRGTVTLTQRIPGEAWMSQTVSVDKNGVGSVEVGPLRGDLTIVATDGRSASDTAIVRVTDRPFVGAVSMRATYPSYLGRPAEGLAVGEPARVPRGTVIEIAGRASTALRSVKLGADDTVSLSVSDHSFSGRFSPIKSGKYTWVAAGMSGPIADVPLPLELEVVPDSAPHVELVSPTIDTLVAGDDRIPVRATASDDHGLSRVELVSWKQGAGAQSATVQRLADATSNVWDGSTVVDLASRGLKPGDALHVKIVATDNSPWAQRGESRELLLKIPTMEERRAIARDALDSAVSQAKSAAASEKSLQQRTSDAARDRSQRSNPDSPSNANGNNDKKGSMSYDAAEKAKAVAKDQRELADQVKKLQENAAQLEQQLKQAGALDSALARQLQEAQQMLRDALSPELLAQMQKLENATQQLSKDQAQQSLKDLQAMQEKLREQLEKSAEMLKRAAMEGAMQTLKDEAKEIADQNRKLADSVKNQNNQPSDAQKEQAKQLGDREQRFSDDAKKLQDRLEKDKADAGAQGTKEAKQRADAAQDASRKAAGQQQQQQGQKQDGQKQDGQKQDGQKQNGQQQNQAGQQQNQSGQQQNQAGSQSQQSKGQQGQQKDQQGQQGQQGQKGQQGQQGNTEQNARDAADQMDKASQAMKDARESQVNEWKSELTNALDQAIQETLQMARQEQQLEQKARSGQSKPDELRGEQSAIKQGLDNAAQKLQQEGQKTSLLSGRSQRSMSEAQQKVSDAMQATADSRNGQQAASALGEAADALNRAAASLARDREKANTSNSATGFAEMMQQLQEMAKKQGNINSQAQSLMPSLTGQPMSGQQQATSRALAREQRQVAQQLDEMGEAVGGDRAAQLAKEAKALAEALEGGRLDATTVARQQQLFRRLLDAGRSLEKEEREDSEKRQATAAKGGNETKPDNTNATGRNATKFREPSWDELRGLSADERRAILEYFKRINASGTP